MSGLLQDLRYALRQLRRNPGFTAVTVLTLALGIGVNAAMFAVIDAVLLRPLPFPKPGQIVQMSESRPEDLSGPMDSISSLPDIRDWSAQSHSFQGIGWYTEGVRSVDVPGYSDFIPVIASSSNLFSILQVQPALGRGFLPEDDQPGHGDGIILNTAAWERFFGDSPDVIGRSLKLGEKVYTVVGVMPPSFEFPAVGGGPTVWQPLLTNPQYEARDSRALTSVGRLKPGVSIAAAEAELSGIQSNIAKAYPKLELDKRVAVKRYRDVLTGNVRPALLALQFAVLAVWLIACANVASLMLSRTTARRREIAVRSAIGAARARIVRQFLTESLLLAFIGAALGLGLAYGCVRVLRFYIDLYLPLAYHIQIDLRVVAALIGFSILSAVLFGLIPAIQAARAPAEEALREGTPAAGVGRRQKHFRDALVVGEIALSLLLLISAGLLLRSLLALRNVPLGFVSHNVVTTSIFLPQGSGGGMLGNSGKYAGKDIAQVFYRPLLDRLSHLPGVDSAAITTALPLSPHFQARGSFEIVGRPKDPSNKPVADVRAVSPSLYRTLGIRLLQGRLLSDSDGPAGAAVAIVNQALVRRYFPGQNPLGQQLKIADSGPHAVVTIVGVVENTHQTSMSDEAQPEINVSYAQLVPGDELQPILSMFSNVALRTHVAPTAVIPSLRTTLRNIDPDLVVLDIQTLQDKVDTSLGSQTLAVRLLWIFAGSALLIAIAGIYGLLAYNVSQRTRDIGLRMALGATRSNVLGLVLRQAVLLLVIGVGIGVIAAISAGSVLRSFLFGVAPYDAWTIAGVCLLLLACGLFASYIPARRASRIDPMKALRWE